MNTTKYAPETYGICAGDASFVKVSGIVKPINAGSATRAAFIARACNAHEALVSVLETLVNDENVEITCRGQSLDLSEARAALKLAREGVQP